MTLRRDLIVGGRRFLIVLFLLAGDLVAFYLSLGVAYVARSRLMVHWFPMPFVQTFPDLLSRLWIPLVIIGVFAYEGLYSKRAPFWEETRQIVRSLFFSTMTIFAIVSLGKMSSEISRAVIVGTGILSLILIPLVRYFWKPFLHARGLGLKNSVLVGDNTWGRLAHMGLFRDHYMGIRIVGRVEPDNVLLPSVEPVPSRASLSGEEAPAVPVLGALSELPEIVKVFEIRGAVVAHPEMRRESLAPLIDEVQRHVLSIYLVPNIAQVNLVNSELTYLFYEEIFLLGIHNNLKSRVNRAIKSLADFLLALLLFLPLLPVLAVLGTLVALSSPGPVFFTQWRVGRGGKPFRIVKFRTMVEGAEETLEKMLQKDPLLKQEFEEKQKLTNDPRITGIGKFLRRTSLDELPQIINVLRGEMSLVGPRPVTGDELEYRYRENAASYCLVRPGITGLWQVSGRSERDYGVRVRLDLWYIRNWSLWFDLVILVRTLGVVFQKRGAC